MEKKNIFKKIDDLYTKATKVIIGDIPHDGEDQEIPSAQEKAPSSKTQKQGIKNKLVLAKEKLLNLGKPADEKALLYEEVVKKERAQSSQEEKKATSSPSPKTKTASTKKPASSTTKKTSTKQTKSATDKKTATKKPATKTTSTTAKKSATATKKTKTASNTKKPAAKKENTTTKTTSAAKKPAAKKTKSTNSKTAEVKTTTTKAETKKKTAEKKSTTTKKTTTKKTTTVKGGKRAEKIALYAKHIKKYYGEVDKDFLTIVVKNLGPSIYKENAEIISCSDPKELKTVRKNFLIKKLGIDASDGVLNAAIQDVCEELKSTRTKYRATFYYALAKKFKKESVLS